MEKGKGGGMPLTTGVNAWAREKNPEKQIGLCPARRKVLQSSVGEVPPYFSAAGCSIHVPLISAMTN
jgi:hypothetical protein